MEVNLSFPELLTEYECETCNAAFRLEYSPTDTNNEVPASCPFCGHVMDYGITTDDEDDVECWDDDDMGDDDEW